MPRPDPGVWAVVDLGDDPTPGDPDILDRLAAEYTAIADDAESAASLIGRLQSADLGEGRSLDKLREKLDELPEQIGKLRDSYRDAAEAITGYAPRLRTHQDAAERARLLAEEAQSRLDAATAELDVLNASFAAASQDPADTSVDRIGADRDAARNRSDAASTDLTVAKRLAADAQELRVSDASTAVTTLAEAEANAVREKSFFEKFASLIGLIVGVIGFVAGIIALFVTGPIGFLLTAISIAAGIAGLGITGASGAISGFDGMNIAELVLGAVATLLGVGALVAALKTSFGLGRGVSHVIKTFNKPTLAKPPPRISVSLPEDIPLAPVPAARPPAGGAGGGLAPPAPAIRPLGGVLGGPSAGHLNESILGAIKRMMITNPFTVAEIRGKPFTFGANLFGISSGIIGVTFGGVGVAKAEAAEDAEDET
ncbi:MULTISPECIES: hypothetical protein [Actinoplanes]|uniref:hypothetical protein n=1 Tax=Actinoplanes TaxID=1865 RepID=UPI0005F2CD1C|nr:MULTISPECIES: hypothetical protein [Actinoplanes]GLY00677.1 hypothetical protein Acsp01_10560 [Actinoplanes sp. NBRC 101535]